MPLTCKKWTLAKEFVGKVATDNFKLEEETLPDELNEGGQYKAFLKEVQVEALFWNIDPYTRLDGDREVYGGTVATHQIGIVTDTKSKTFPVGSHVLGELGWRTHTIASEDDLERLPDTENVPISMDLGVLGVSGLTAYFGTTEILDLQPGKILAVSSAAGSVGNVAGQIGKNQDCVVIGFTGSDEKCRWLKEELGFDHAFNYKTVDLEKALAEAAPGGVDYYFDNVGGEFSSKMLEHMGPHGRMACCGCTSAYQASAPQEGPYPFWTCIWKRTRIEGFHVRDFEDRWSEGRTQLLEWMHSGKIKGIEHITEGFNNIPQAFVDMFEGKNLGKAIVKA